MDTYDLSKHLNDYSKKKRVWGRSFTRMFWRQRFPRTGPILIGSKPRANGTAPLDSYTGVQYDNFLLQGSKLNNSISPDDQVMKDASIGGCGDGFYMPSLWGRLQAPLSDNYPDLYYYSVGLIRSAALIGN